MNFKKFILSILGLFIGALPVFAFTAEEQRIYDGKIAALGQYLTSQSSIIETFDNMDRGSLLYNLNLKRFDNENSWGLLYYPHYNEFWIRGYVKRDDVSLKNGPDTHSDSYGLYVGMDQAIDLGLPAATLSFYFGYNGAEQKNEEVNTYLNRDGAILGLTLVAQEEYLFYGATVNGLYNKNKVQGQTYFDSYGFNAGFQVGLNFTSEEALITFQPSVIGSYSFIAFEKIEGVIDYDNAHIWQIAPQALMLFNLDRGVQPYLKALGSYSRMIDKTDEGVDVPDVYLKSYLEYGLGLQIQWVAATSFIEATWRTGGLDGVSIRAGINF